MRYILITGGTGFIGSHLVEALLNNGKKVILLKRSFSDLWRIKELISNRNLILINIDEVDLVDIFKKYDIKGIFHLSTFAQRIHEYNSISNMINTNIDFPTLLLDNAVNFGVDFFINTGSHFEFSFKSSPISENSNIHPFNLYAATKIAFEDILKYYNENYNLNALTLKFFTPYGPKDDINKITPYLIINSIKKNKILIKSPSKELDFTYIDDIVNSYICAMDNIKNIEGYKSFTIGTGKSTSIPQLLSIIEKYLGKNTHVSYGDLEDDKVFCSYESAEKLLKWKPTVSLENGIRKTIEYYNSINID